MTYIWQDGLPIEVNSDRDGQPKSLIWNRKKHPIHRIFNRWIFHDYWWADDEHEWRDYYFIITETHLILVIFRDVLSGSWFIYQMYD